MAVCGGSFYTDHVVALVLASLERANPAALTALGLPLNTSQSLPLACVAHKLAGVRTLQVRHIPVCHKGCAARQR